MDIPEYLSSGDVARLIPVASEGSKEVRAASILLAVLGAVPDFAKSMLSELGVRIGARTSLECFTEVVFKQVGGGGNGDRLRPDGLIVLQSGQGRTWKCLVEAKIGKAEIDQEQITKYVALAKANGVDAVLSLSNQFVPLPTHSPVKLPKTAIRGIDLFHWSWMHILTQAMLLLHEDAFERLEQKYILSEAVRYFTHPSIGVSTFDRMNSEWKDIVSKVQASAPLLRSSPEVESTVAAWHQEIRDLALLMSRKLNRLVQLKLARAHADDAATWLHADAEVLASSHELRCTLDVPDAASPISIIADLGRRNVAVSMSLTAPKERQRTSSRVNWLLRQLAKADPEGASIKAYWPGRAPATQASLAALRENPNALEASNPNIVPLGFDVTLVRDLAGRFSGARTFIEELEDAVPAFYEQLGQHLRAYVPTPPKLVRKSEDGVELNSEQASDPSKTTQSAETTETQNTAELAPSNAEVAIEKTASDE